HSADHVQLQRARHDVPAPQSGAAGDHRLRARAMAFVVRTAGHEPRLFSTWGAAVRVLERGISSEYPYFFRETQRAMQPGQIPCYLARVDQKGVSPLAPIEKQLEARHPYWFPGERGNRAPVFVKRIDGQDFMDYGVSRDQAEAFMRLLAGIDAGRPAD